MRHALNSLAIVAPEWLRTVSPSEWKERYARRAEDDRLPTTQAARAALALAIGHDGWRLLAGIDHTATPPWLREIPAVVVLRRVWIRNYLWDGTQLQWREAGNIPPAAQFISSPYDLDAHYARKHTTQWVGYKVHLTESCEDDLPHLITHVETTQVARQREAMPAFQAEDARRAGIEGTISRETRRLRLRRTRYIGLRRVHRGPLLAAVGLNVWRLDEWFLETSRANTRITPFARLMADGAAA